MNEKEMTENEIRKVNSILVRCERVLEIIIKEQWNKLKKNLHTDMYKDEFAEFSRWRWGIPEVTVKWIWENIGRNIVMFFDHDKKTIHIETNAWIDNDIYIKNKVYRTRNWYHEKAKDILLSETNYNEELLPARVRDISTKIRNSNSVFYRIYNRLNESFKIVQEWNQENLTNQDKFVYDNPYSLFSNT